jgi:predicted ferric reductase
MSTYLSLYLSNEQLLFQLLSNFDISYQNGARLILLISPVLIVSCLCLLLVTNAPLPRRCQHWANMFFASLRTHESHGASKKNQFGIGELSFNLVAVFLVAMPVFGFLILTIEKAVIGQQYPLVKEEKLRAISNAAGMAGTLALSFFLIPVARHSVLLVALGWNPLQALRIHIWAGYVSYLCIALHGAIHLGIFICLKQESLSDQIIPGSKCWEWNPTEKPPRSCRSQWYNFTGLLAFLFMTVLILTSLNWFRRRHYRLFYIFHVVCGIGMLAGAAMHWRPIITFIAPSLIYYLASTMPALIQALASRFRGGVNIQQVVHLKNAGGCKEIHLATSTNTSAALEQQPSMYVKLCAPSISLVWHPFTVYKHPRDPTTLRILVRPVGPFTKQLALRWEQERHTVTLVDGFYQTGNRCLEALQHDHVTVICGGIAITPFLSFIPNLLHLISTKVKNGEEIITKTLTLHWACRESGLAQYVLDNYLHGMKLAADAVGFEFDVFVYNTGGRYAKRPPPTPLDPSEDDQDYEHGPQSSPTGDATFLSVFSVEEIDLELDEDEEDKQLAGSEHAKTRPPCRSEDCEVPNNPEEKMESKRKGCLTMSTKTDSKQEVIKVVHYVTPTHSFETSRFMPAKHSRVWQNLPAFVAVGGSMWLFFYIIFYYYHGYEVYVHENYDRLWSLIVCFLTSIGLGVVFEVCALFVRKYWPTLGAQVQPHQEDPSEYIPVDEETRDALVIHNLNERPFIPEIVQAAGQAECPGIFMCGPSGMTKLVKEEVAKENSIFGLTRYAVYEDPFEM